LDAGGRVIRYHAEDCRGPTGPCVRGCETYFISVPKPPRAWFVVAVLVGAALVIWGSWHEIDAREARELAEDRELRCVCPEDVPARQPRYK
jgi:hypothetical protein